MTKAQQKKFVKDLLKDTTQALMNHAEHWPGGWDGVELRELVADKFQQVRDSTFDKRGRRGREYREAVTSVL